MKKNWEAQATAASWTNCNRLPKQDSEHDYYTRSEQV